jgi:import inner membrane translocase subunit TIM13
MDPFSSPPLSGSAEGPSNEVVMDKVKQQLAQAYAEEFFSCETNALQNV